MPGSTIARAVLATSLAALVAGCPAHPGVSQQATAHEAPDARAREARADGTARRPDCWTRPAPPRYPDVAPIFARRCGKCHDKARGGNARAQAVFEMTRYPFTTDRPKKLLGQLDHMFESRGGIPDRERCLVRHWLRRGALDAAGRRPPYRPL